MLSAHKEIMRKHFSMQAERWRDIYYENDRYHSIVIQKRKKLVIKCIKSFAQNRRSKILDIGCGSGGIMNDVVELNHSVIGMDISLEMTARAKNLLKKNITRDFYFVNGDLEDLPFGENSLDAIICVGVLEYLESDEKAIEEISRVVKPGGGIIITVPNLLKIQHFLDPFTFCRVCKYIFLKAFGNRLGLIKRYAPEDFIKNTDFICRRYRFGQLKLKFKRKDLSLGKVYAVGYGPFTFLGKQIFSLKWNLKINDILETFSRIKGFKFLAWCAIRWVIYLNKKPIP